MPAASPAGACAGTHAYVMPLGAHARSFEQRGKSMDVKLLACVAITRMCSDRMVVKPMIACASPPPPPSHASVLNACFRYKGIHALVKVAGEVDPDSSALRMQASRALARLALDPDAHQPIMMSGALQHILALAKQDHMDPLRLDGAPLHCTPLCPGSASVHDACAGTLALSKLGVAPMCRQVIVNHLSDVLASPAGVPEVCRKALAEVHSASAASVAPPILLSGDPGAVLAAG